MDEFCQLSFMSEAKKNKVLIAARTVFLRYGFKRVGMHDIAAGAGISRPALYLLFKNKEEIFTAVLLHWIEETLALARIRMDDIEKLEEKLIYAFEVWTITPFEMMKASPEAKELFDGAFEFSQLSLRQGYQMFEQAITPVVASLVARHPAKARLAPAAIAHLLASASRGFKQTAGDAAELRRMIEGMLILAFDLDEGAFAKPGTMPPGA